MAGSVNKVILIGNLGKDPEIRKIDNGVSVASFPLATSETYTDKATGSKKEITDWHDIVLWRGLAELAEKYLHKGTKIYVEGRLKKRSWQDKEGNTRYTTEVVGDNLTILSKPEGTEKSHDSHPPYSNEGAPKLPTDLDPLFDKEPGDLPF